MAGITLTSALRDEYVALFNSCSIRSARTAVVERLVTKLQSNRSRYEAAAGSAGVPWYFIAVIHNMEAGQRFSGHLHNGDPLSARTTHVPAGRPKQGNPPFTWEDSAADAMSFKRLGPSTDWSLGGMLYQLERYNGWGYRKYHPHVLSPYLWSFSHHYESGKYVADGRWSDTAVSKQCGAAVLLRRMAENGIIEFPDQPAPVATDAPLIVSLAKRKPINATVLQRAKDLQAWLNTYPGIFLKVDGWPGKKTSDAYYKVTGYYLPGDARG
ncbi:hypothetical protein KQI65_15755 [bacterium]|nr:hypothetical protein [bacterium]